MCIICVDYAKGKLTTQEAQRALGEMAETLDRTHLAELQKKLADDAAAAPPAKRKP